MTAPATTELYPLSLHDALPISGVDALDDDALADLVPDIAVVARGTPAHKVRVVQAFQRRGRVVAIDRKSTRLNSSHRCISYAVFCLKKKISNLAVFDLLPSFQR